MFEKFWNADFVAKVFGVTFLAAGIIGFAPNPIAGATGFFEANAAHNLVHIVTGVAFLIGANLGSALLTIRAVAVAYVAVTIAGFLTPGHLLLGFIHINEADKWLHAALAAAIIAAGCYAPAVRRLSHAHV
jgi:hypothetical protein